MNIAAAVLASLRRRRIEKCAATNHALREPERHKFYAWPSESIFNAVADVLIIDVRQCKCGLRVEGYEISRSGLQGLTMSSSEWDGLREFGMLDY